MSDQAPPHRFDIPVRCARRAAALGLPEWLGHLAFVLALLAVLVLVGFVLTLLWKLAVGLWSADASNYQVQRNIGAALFALLGFLFAGWRALVAQKQADVVEQTNITSRINEAVRMLGATQTVKVRRRSVEWEATDPEGNPVEGTRRHAWEYEGAPPPLPPWHRPVDPEKREATEFKDAEETRPHIEVRLGALYALERIAQDSERDHIPIMETLCAYIRENAPAREAPSLGLPELEPLPEDADEAQRSARARRLAPFEPEARCRAPRLPPLRADLQTALTVIGRREAKRRRHEDTRTPPYRLDLRQTDLQRADLSVLWLDRANLSKAKLDGAHLAEAKLEGTNLGGATLVGANLDGAKLDGAFLRGANLEGAHLVEARLEGADLLGAELEGAILVEARLEGALLLATKLEGADLGWARLEGTNLHLAKLEGAELRGADLEGAYLQRVSLASTDCSEATFDGAALKSVEVSEESNIGPDQIANAFWDGSLSLPFPPPEACAEPWRRETLTDDAFRSRWQGWREVRDLAWPPLGRALSWPSDTPAIPPDAPLRDDEIAR